MAGAPSLDIVLQNHVLVHIEITSCHGAEKSPHGVAYGAEGEEARGIRNLGLQKIGGSYDFESVRLVGLFVLFVDVFSSSEASSYHPFNTFNLVKRYTI